VRVLVTGGTGYIGRALVVRLLRDGHEVRLAARAPQGEAARALLELGATVHGWTAGETPVPAQLPGADAVFHLAAHLPTHGDDPVQHERVNVRGAQDLFRWAAAGNAARLVVASTVEAVGPFSIEEGVPDETARPRPTGTYGTSKRVAERMLEEACSAGVGPSVAVARIGYVYGERPGFWPVIERAIDVAFRGAMPPRRTEDRLLPFVHREDVIEGLVRMAPEAGLRFWTYNLAARAPVTDARVLAAALGDAGDERLRRRYLARQPLPEGRVHLGLSIHRAQEELGYDPRFEIEEGMAAEIRWRQEQGTVLPAPLPGPPLAERLFAHAAEAAREGWGRLRARRR
jgi:nucleoside-diphosphate-sugar epimerase